eukprot:scaffold104900_cov31-Tisochrysis_lutea.AAC.2
MRWAVAVAYGAPTTKPMRASVVPVTDAMPCPFKADPLNGAASRRPTFIEWGVRAVCALPTNPRATTPPIRIGGGDPVAAGYWVSRAVHSMKRALSAAAWCSRDESGMERRVVAAVRGRVTCTRGL